MRWWFAADVELSNNMVARRKLEQLPDVVNAGKQRSYAASGFQHVLVSIRICTAVAKLASARQAHATWH